jgi:hypothetical protein
MYIVNLPVRDFPGYEVTTTIMDCDVDWETIATWLDETLTVVAPMRFANRRSSSGGIASSFSATRRAALSRLKHPSRLAGRSLTTAAASHT